MAQVLLALLLMGLCCAGPFLLLPLVPLVWGFVTANGALVLVGALLFVAGIGYLAWQRRRAPVPSLPSVQADGNSGEGLQTLTLTVPSITCEACTDTVRDALLTVPGVRAVAAETRRKTVAVSFDPERTGPAALVEAIRRAGHSVRVPK
jgi:copper chaperone CopZ